MVAQCNTEMLCAMLSSPQALGGIQEEQGWKRSIRRQEMELQGACPDTLTTQSEGCFHLPPPHHGAVSLQFLLF